MPPPLVVGVNSEGGQHRDAPGLAAIDEIGGADHDVADDHTVVLRHQRQLGQVVLRVTDRRHQSRFGR